MGIIYLNKIRPLLMNVNKIDLILGRKVVNKIRNSKILIIGSGGIGCELVKNLAHTNFQKIEIKKPNWKIKI